MLVFIGLKIDFNRVKLPHEEYASVFVTAMEMYRSLVTDSLLIYKQSEFRFFFFIFRYVIPPCVFFISMRLITATFI